MKPLGGLSLQNQSFDKSIKKMRTEEKDAEFLWFVNSLLKCGYLNFFSTTRFKNPSDKMTVVSSKT